MMAYGGPKRTHTTKEFIMKKSIIIVVLVLMSLTTNAHAWGLWHYYRTVNANCPASDSQELMVVATKAILAQNRVGLVMLTNTGNVEVIRAGQKVHVVAEEKYAGIDMVKAKIKNTGKELWLLKCSLD
jgi:hypothetical protein